MTRPKPDLDVAVRLDTFGFGSDNQLGDPVRLHSETVTDPLTAEEKGILKTAAFGAIFLVSNADPGLLPMLRESFAASAAIAGATGLVRTVLTTGALPELPMAGLVELEATVLSALRCSVRILRDKAPQEVENYQAVVARAIDQVARADRIVSGPEATAVTKIRDALWGTPAD